MIDSLSILIYTLSHEYLKRLFAKCDSSEFSLSSRLFLSCLHHFELDNLDVVESSKIKKNLKRMSSAFQVVISLLSRSGAFKNPPLIALDGIKTHACLPTSRIRQLIFSPTLHNFKYARNPNSRSDRKNKKSPP